MRSPYKHVPLPEAENGFNGANTLSAVGDLDVDVDVEDMIDLPDFGELREDQQIAMLAQELHKSPSLKLETSAAALKQVVARMGGEAGVIEVEEVERLINAVVNCNYMTWRRAG